MSSEVSRLELIVNFSVPTTIKLPPDLSEILTVAVPAFIK